MRRNSFNENAGSMLDGLRVIDLSRVVAGNMLTLQLADHGADVVKIEPLPNGDPLRSWKENGYSMYWKVYARNKRSLGLNFRAEGASEVIFDLAVKADVLVEGFRPAPNIGEHTRIILEESGFDDARIAALQDAGIVGGNGSP